MFHGGRVCVVRSLFSDPLETKSSHTILSELNFLCRAVFSHSSASLEFFLSF